MLCRAVNGEIDYIVQPAYEGKHDGAPSHRTILYDRAVPRFPHTAFTNKVLTDSPLWIRRIVSAIKGAIESMVIFGSRFSGGMGTVLVVTISTISRCSRSS